ncbi:MAG: hypothetical protein LAQ30_14750 [Acidobacteriia bacterium]|nr:hypothetical protein [Terriglobia bacterium]
MMRITTAGCLLGILLAGRLSLAADNNSTSADDIAQLKAQLAAQQAQIDELRKELQGQKNSGLESRDRVTPAEGASTAPAAATPASAQVPPERAGDAAPLTFHIGTAAVTPIGFMDFTTVYRNRTGGSGIGTNFGGIPYSNTVPGQLSEFRFSAQNSRIGLRVDAKVHGANVLGYLESDFLGFSPGNAAVSSNSNSLRMRLYWVDVRKGKSEILGGQSWSLLTPNRVGLSPLPSDLFYSQDIDVNYQLGLTWSRNPGFRFVYHPADRLALGVAVEAAEQYAGGSAGGGVITLPSAISSAYAGQIDTGGNTFGVPNQRPDVIGKIAWDPRVARRHMHIEVAGVLSGFRFYNPLNQTRYTTQGGGGSLNLNLELTRKFRLVTNNFYSDGGGRWIFGQGPDLIVRGDGSPSLVRASSTVSGFEYQPSGAFLLYAYYGGAYFGKNVAIDPANGKLVGYGYPGSPNGQNRAIQEATFGFTDTFWKDPRYGALQFMTQYSYLARNPWSVAAGQPASANVNMVFLNLRYTLPGSAPHIE